MVNYARKSYARDLETIPRGEQSMFPNESEDNHEEFESISTIIQSKYAVIVYGVKQ